MGVTVDTPATETDLVQLSVVQRELGVGDDEKDRLIRLIDAASSSIAGDAQSFLGYPAARQTYTETLPGTNTTFLVLARIPVVSVSSVLQAGVAITDYSIEIPERGMLRRDYGWDKVLPSSGMDLSRHPLPHAPEYNYSVTYVAGWLLPGEAGRTLPPAIEEAALETVKAWWSERSAEGPALKSLRTGDVTEVYGEEERTRFALPSSAVNLLRRYRRLSVGLP